LALAALDDNNILKVIEQTFRKLQGSYACGIIDNENKGTLYAVKSKSPMLIGIGEDFNTISSDVLAVCGYTKLFKEIKDGEIIVLTADDVVIYDYHLKVVKRETKTIKIDDTDIELGASSSFMEKEIEEQPAVIRKIISEYYPEGQLNIDDDIKNEIKKATKIYIIASGTSFNAALIGKNYFATIAKKDVEVINASEFIYQAHILDAKPLFIIMSQSGESADSRTVLELLNKQKRTVICMTNTEGSTLSRESKYTLLLHAGREISVASTKAYTAQITLLYILANAQTKDQKEVIFNLSQVATVQDGIVLNKQKYHDIVKAKLADQQHVIFLGKGNLYYLSLEAALKMKEISYIIAEAYPAGELKHGPISLIEEGLPVIVMIQNGNEAGHVRSNIQEVITRGANVVVISSESFQKEADDVILPDVDENLIPLSYLLVIQYFAYFETIERGLDVDKPRNLAKSVTVE